MRDDIGAAPADILGHPDPGAVDLSGAAFAAELLRHLDDLVHAGRADRVTAGFQTTPGCDRDAAARSNRSIQGQARSLASFGETAGLQR